MRRVLQSLISRQREHVEALDRKGLQHLLRGVSQLRLPPLRDGHESKWKDARILATQIFLDEERCSAAMEWIMRYREVMPSSF